MIQAPCKDCLKKGCGSFHDECQKYLDWTEYRKKIAEAERKRKEEERKYKR